MIAPNKIIGNVREHNRSHRLRRARELEHKHADGQNLDPMNRPKTAAGELLSAGIHGPVLG